MRKKSDTQLKKPKKDSDSLSSVPEKKTGKKASTPRKKSDSLSNTPEKKTGKNADVPVISKKLKKSELVTNLGKALDIPKEDAKLILDAVFTLIESSLLKGYDVEIPRVGVIKVAQRADMSCFNPQFMDAPRRITNRKCLTFKGSLVMRKALNGRLDEYEGWKEDSRKKSELRRELKETIKGNVAEVVAVAPKVPARAEIVAKNRGSNGS